MKTPSAPSARTSINKPALYWISGTAAAISLAAVFFLQGRVPEPEPPRESAPATHSAASGTAPIPEGPRTGAPVLESVESLPEQSRRPVLLLREILASKNDNDPRLDRDFRNLSPGAKAALRGEYHALAPEDRNGRGTVVFLLGREIAEASDVEFMREVLSEAPCLSPTDCSADLRAPGGADSHQISGMEVSLAYPQLVALKSIEGFLARARGGELAPALRDAAWKAVEAGKASRVPLVQAKAIQLAKTLEGR